MNDDQAPPAEELLRVIAAQGNTIQALQQRLWHLESEIVDMMAASIASATAVPELAEAPE